MKPVADHDPYTSNRVCDDPSQDLLQLGNDDGLEPLINEYPSGELCRYVRDAAPGSAVGS